MISYDRKIKVCHLAPGDVWAGAEVQLATLIESLLKMPDLETSMILLNEGRLTDEMRDLGVRTHVIPEFENNRFSIVKELVRYLERHPVDILHAHKPKDNVLGALASLWAKIPYRVRTIHGFHEPRVGFQAIKGYVHEIIDNGVNRWLIDRIVAVSFDLRSQLSRRFGTEKVVYVQNAIDIDKIQITRCSTVRRKELKLGGQEFLVGAMGRLTLGKGFECFLKAARIIAAERPNVKFIIAGGGPLRDSLEALAKEYGLYEDVLFLGHRDNSHDILELFDLFVLPSFSEGTPMVLLEALVLARPVVASRVGGIPEVIEHGISGLLVTPGREDEFARSCIALMDDYGWAQRLGAAGRKRVEERFSARLMAAKVAEVYRKLVCNGESQ